MFNIKTPHGEIHYAENIIKKIVISSASQYDGKVMLYNFSKKLPGFVPGWAQKKNPGAAASNAIRIMKNEDDEGNLMGFEVQAFVVVRFGTSIKHVTNGMIDYIYEYSEKIMNTKPTKVTISVTGVLSKSMVRRDIEVSR